MIKIRLKRTGKRGQPHYRIVVMQSTKPRDGRSVEEIGYYNPRHIPPIFEIDKERAKYWLERGAQPTDTIAQYLVKEGVLDSLKRGATKPNVQKGAKKDKKE
ncbi:MAG: 30S ribosomal protein S16 [Candidatus Dojkabacteria bacterium]|jgi:small subunit ribosomal protein S16|nr:30S ribosomal protein S16 [Candidatus Dojkabacteria bacterium]MDD2269973.1 30S ribosomal protein S16 [Candidatus Dojkabacteria bacterium]